jgi:hypothetical protein
MLLSAAFPDSRLIHIHRNPLNVVSSLLEGKVMPVHTMTGAINYWVESMQNMDAFKQGASRNLMEVSYEEFTRRPDRVLPKLLTFIDEDPKLLKIPPDYIHEEKNRYKEKLSREQIAIIKKQCEPYLTRYNYK